MAIYILEKYLPKVTRYSIHSIEMYRGENPMDLFYHCAVGSRSYIVVETDYIDSLSHLSKLAKEIFPEYTTLHWLVKRDHQPKLPPQITADTDIDSEKHRNALIFAPNESYLRYVVMAAGPVTTRRASYHPNTYGARF